MTPRQPAPHIGRRCQSRTDVERRPGGSPRARCFSFLPHLRDRARARRGRNLQQLLRPPRPGLRLGDAARHGDAGAHRGRAPVDLAVRRLAPRRSAGRRAPGTGHDAPAARPAPCCRAGDRRALAQARHRQPDPLVQGPGGRRRRTQGAGARPDDALVLVDREPGRGRRGTRGSRGPRGGRLRPRRPGTGEAPGRRRLRADRLRGERALRPLLAPLGRAVVRAALGLRQREPALLLRGGIEDDRLRDRRAARLGGP